MVKYEKLEDFDKSHSIDLTLTYWNVLEQAMLNKLFLL